MDKLHIGIDVGGTNTDGVLINQQQTILATCKIPTENPLEKGVKKCIQTLLKESSIAKKQLGGIYLGTTHATNAILEAKNLFKVGVLRLAGQKTTLLPPCFKWPTAIRQAVDGGMVSVNGGFRCDQKAISSLVESEIRQALETLVNQGMESLAIIGVFSPLSSSQETEAAKMARYFLDEAFPITLSSEVGGVGFIERENAAILNACLKRPMTTAFQNLEGIKRELGIHAPFYITQNDGSIIEIQQAIEKPLLTISSGPTNSFIGGVKLAALKEAIIVDIGGTSADIGVVLDGYPRRSLGQAVIGGIALNFRMPDVLSLPIGGGTILRRKAEGFTLGPDSLGSHLFTKGCSFGGDILTLTDAAQLSGFGTHPLLQRDRIPLTDCEAKSIIEMAVERIQEAICIMKGNKTDLPVVAVGGGAYFLKNSADVIPAHSGVANAYGAALAEISHTVDSVISLEDREQALEHTCRQALEGAALKGAKKASVRIVDLQVIPYHYIPHHLARVVATASG